MELDTITLQHLAMLAGGGLVAGLIDSIVGGGGLITVPIFLLILGPNATAIGSNKVAAVAAQVVAFAIYWRRGHVVAGQSAVRVLVTTSIGSVVGALMAPHLPREFFQWFMLIIAPIVLILVFTKSVWQNAASAKAMVTGEAPSAARLHRVDIATFAAGLYDGVAGPGGGTLMFLGLMIYGGLPVSIAMGTGKLANLGSATLSLVTYAAQGHVQWLLGSIAAVPIGIGAYWGSRLATRAETAEQSAKIARTALVVVSVLLLLRWCLL